MELDQRAFRNALGHFATGVAVVTADGGQGDPVAMTVSSFNSVSLDPPLVLFSVMRTSPSLEALIQCQHFGVSVLRGDQGEISSRFAGQSGRKWEGLTPISGDTGVPLIGDCLAHFECTPHAVHDGGDHQIIVGRVLACATQVAMQADATQAGDMPLIYFRGAYRGLAQASA